jgi:FdhD protein
MATTARPVLRAERGIRGEALDWLAVEEPLEVRVDGEPLATILRTPGHDARLALGFLFSEGIVAGIDDVGTIAHCERLGDEARGNVIDVRSGPGVLLAPELAPGRATAVNASCGVCGRRTIADLCARAGALPEDGTTVAAGLVAAMMERLSAAMPAFQRTGGIHGAAAFTASGEMLACHEDVGRHNAVDKTVGALLLARRCGAGARAEGRPAVLCVSGRAGFEIVQKAAVARIPVVASVSAASSLSVDLARESGLTLASFVRGGRLSIYSCAARIV